MFSKTNICIQNMESLLSDGGGPGQGLARQAARPAVHAAVAGGRRDAGAAGQAAGCGGQRAAPSAGLGGTRGVGIVMDVF